MSRSVFSRHRSQRSLSSCPSTGNSTTRGGAWRRLRAIRPLRLSKSSSLMTHQPQDTTSALASIDGIRVVRNDRNEGFLRSCNRGARPGARPVPSLSQQCHRGARMVDELIATFAEVAGCGVVGAQLVFPDGRLQEAGGIVWRDGAAGK